MQQLLTNARTSMVRYIIINTIITQLYTNTHIKRQTDTPIHKTIHFWPFLRYIQRINLPIMKQKQKFPIMHLKFEGDMQSKNNNKTPKYIFKAIWHMHTKSTLSFLTCIVVRLCFVFPPNWTDPVYLKLEDFNLLYCRLANLAEIWQLSFSLAGIARIHEYFIENPWF